MSALAPPPTRKRFLRRGGERPFALPRELVARDVVSIGAATIDTAP